MSDSEKLQKIHNAASRWAVSPDTQCRLVGDRVLEYIGQGLEQGESPTLILGEFDTWVGDELPAVHMNRFIDEVKKDE